MTRRPFVRPLQGAATCAALIPVGCSQAPSYDIMGSLIPGWLACIALGVMLSALARWLLLRFHVAPAYPVLVYPCLAAAITFSIWLIFF